jgi:RNA polymerase sigma factor (sigma-70 family)
MIINGKENKMEDNLIFNSNDDLIEGLSINDALKQYEPMVHRFVNEAKTNHVCSKEDLCQEGRMAIVIAFRHFNPEYGASLTTWMYHMIKSAIIEYQKNHLSILSGGAYLQSILRKAGEDASVEEIMDLGVSKKTALASTYIKDSFSSVDYDELSSYIGDDGISIDKIESLPWRSYLNEVEIYAIENYFGFNGSRMTKTNIGEKLGRSRKAVDYLIKKALVKLRKIEGIEWYAPY